MVHTPVIYGIIRKNMRKTKFLSLLLVAALTVTSLVTAPDVSAAKKPKLNCKKKFSMTVGKTKTIKVKNGKKSAKVTWKTSKKKVVKLSKQVKKGNKASVKLKAVKKGKAKITATYKLGKKKTKLTCTVTVKNATPPAPTNPVPNPPAPTNPVPNPPVQTPTPDVPNTDNPSTPTPTPDTPTDPPKTDTPPTPTPTPSTPTPTPSTPTDDPGKDWSKPLSVDLSTVRKDSTSKYDSAKNEVVINDASGDSLTWFDLPEKVAANETVEITINGVYTGNTGFRTWIGDGQNSFSTPEMFAADFANGDFAKTFSATNAKPALQTNLQSRDRHMTNSQSTDSQSSQLP